MQHSTYDSFWQKRNILPHLNHIKPAVLTVGGWYDAEDLYGTLNIYKSIEKKNPNNRSFLIMGPWGHGGWARTDGEFLGDIWFEQKTSKYYQDEVEALFFSYYLKGNDSLSLPEAQCFDTGKNIWTSFTSWPPNETKSKSLFFSDNHLALDQIPSGAEFSEFLSDPAKPVPFTQKIATSWGKAFMTEDQRFASRRSDVLTFTSEIIKENLTLAGPIKANLYISSSGSGADWIVKLIDVYPDDFSYPDSIDVDVSMGGYQRLIRAEIMRSKFRNNYEKPEALIPNRVTPIAFNLQDVYHTFKKGHRIMVQIQSSWFPLFDRNPQTFCDIYSADEEDFIKAEHRIYHSKEYSSHLKVSILSED